jgi:eukaryotic-like serine/threonine-protein kinase
LGRGGTSEVYAACDQSTGEAVVVKWLTPQAALDPQLRERFLLSARITRTVEHPGILRVFAIEEPADEPPYLVMEPLEGEPLADYLERERAMPEELLVPLARDIAAALSAAHALGIVHRDIKPGNVFLLGPKGEPHGIKIIDFGLAKDLEDPEAGPSSTNLILGTAQYMAPEQVLADPIDARTDIYALGALLFRALTGELPFDLDPGVDLFGHQIFSPAPPPSWLAETMDPRLESLILRCMRKHPENRYSTMDFVWADLEQIRSTPRGTPLPQPLLARAPDVYKPRNPKGLDAAEAIAEYFGTEPPPPATSSSSRLE